MSRGLLALLVLGWICGCSTIGGLGSKGDCDDCLPPPIAGQVYNHTCDNLITSLTAQGCARRDLKEVKRACHGLTADFQRGYTQAYIDLAAGRPACVPAVPPQKYWYAWHRSCAGSEAVEEWYAGYSAGLDDGVNGGVSRFNRIVVPPEGCCISARYVNPYTTPQAPGSVMPANRQTISQAGTTNEPADKMAGNSPIRPVSSNEPFPAPYHSYR